MKKKKNCLYLFIYQIAKFKPKFRFTIKQTGLKHNKKLVNKFGI